MKINYSVKVLPYRGIQIINDGDARNSSPSKITHQEHLNSYSARVGRHCAKEIRKDSLI